MNTLPDVSAFSPSEIKELIDNCNQRPDSLRQEHMQEAQILGLHCALPDADTKQRKPRRNSKQATE
jgi:hypothetical protein